MHGKEKFILDISWEAFLQFGFTFWLRFNFGFKFGYVFDLSKWAKTCITTFVFEVAIDVQSVKVSEYLFKQNRNMLKNKTAIIYIFYNIPLKDAQSEKMRKDNRKPLEIHNSMRIVYTHTV